MHRRLWNLLSVMLAATLMTASSEAAITRSPYQQYIPRGCPSGNICIINFPVVPANFRVEIKSVSCYFSGQETPSLTQIDFAQLIVRRTDSSVAAAVTLVPSQTGSRSDVVTFAANDTIFAFAGAGQHFQIYAKSLAGQFLTIACNIAGERVQLS